MSMQPADNSINPYICIREYCVHEYRHTLMAYDLQLADRIRLHLAEVPRIKVEEKTMFRGLAFLVNGKMCVNVSGENLMCRIDPVCRDLVSTRKGFKPVIMKGREMKGYCYVAPDGIKSKRDFEFWLKLCLDFNPSARSSKKGRSSKK